MFNQVLKRQGVERAIREQLGELAAGERLHLTTATYTHPGTLRLSRVEYKLEVINEAGGTSEIVFVADIEQGMTGRATWSVEQMGRVARQLWK